MNINDLKLFISTVEYESLTKSAAINNTVQSNVTARIKYLEEYLGVKLLNRSTRRMEATEEGIKFLKAAKEIIRSVEDFKTSVSKEKTKPKGSIKIGCIHSTAALRAPGILQNFTHEYPDVDFKLKTGTTSGLIREVLSFKLDGAFVAGKVDHPELLAQPVIVEELCLVSSSMYPSLERLSSGTKAIKLIVFDKGCSYRELLEQTMAEMGLSQLKFLEMDTLDGMINSVESGLGLTLLPVELIKKHYSYRDLSTFALPEHFSKSQTVFVKRKDYPMSDGYTLFLDSIIKGYQPELLSI